MSGTPYAVDMLCYNMTHITRLHLRLPPPQSILIKVDCKDKAVRLRSSELLGSILQTLPADVTIAGDTFLALQGKLLARARDKLPAVRVAAIAGLYRLQDDSNVSECPVASALRWAAAHDPSKDVRSAAVSHFPCDATTIGSLIERVKDVSADVRSAAFARVRAVMPFEMLTPGQRRDLIATGCSDASAAVRTSAAVLLSTWLASCNWDATLLLEGLDFVSPYSYGTQPGCEVDEASSCVPHTDALAAERCAEAALWSLFWWAEQPQPKKSAEAVARDKQKTKSKLAHAADGGDGDDAAGGDAAPVHPSQLDPSELWTGVHALLDTFRPSPANLTPEAAMYWRCRAAWLAGATGLGAAPVPLSISPSIPSSKREEALDALLPEPSVLVDLLSQVVLSLGCVTDTPGQGSLAGVQPRDMAINTLTDQQQAAFRAVAIANGVPVPARLASLLTSPINPDADAVATLRSLLLLGQLLDYGEEVGRRRTIALAMQLVTHTNVPTWCVPLVTRMAAAAFGCGCPYEAVGGAALAAAQQHAGASAAAGFREMVGLMVTATASLRAAIDVCMSGGAGDNQSHDSPALAALYAQADEYRRQLEDADDAGEEWRLEGLTAKLVAVEQQIAAADGGASSSSSSSSHLAAPTVHLDGVEMRSFVPQELAGLLWQRALAVTEALMRGTGVDAGVHGAHLATAITAASRLAFGAHSATTLISSPIVTGLIAPSLVNEWAAIRRAGMKCITLVALAAGRGHGRDVAAKHGPAMCDAALAADGDPSVRVAALHCLSHLAAAFGCDAVTAGSTSVSLPSLLVSLVNPGSIITSAATGGSTKQGKGSTSAVLTPPLAVQAAAAACCAQLVMTSALPLSVGGGIEPCACIDTSTTPASSNSNSSAGGVLTRLAEMRYALLWADAAAASATRDGDDADEAASSALSTLKASLASCRPLSSSLAALLPTYAAMSPLHRAACLSSTVAAYRSMMALAARHGLDDAATAAGMGASVFGGPLGVAATGSGSGGVKAAASGRLAGEADGDEGGADDDGDDAGSVASAGSAVSAVAASAAGAARGGGVSPACAWVGDCVSACLHIACLTPMGSGDGGVPASMLPSWARQKQCEGVEAGSGAAPAPLVLALAMAVDAAADSSTTGLFTPTLLLALKQISPSESSAATDQLTASSVLRGAVSGALSEVSKHSRGVTQANAIKKLTQTWVAGDQLVTASAVKDLISARLPPSSSASKAGLPPAGGARRTAASSGSRGGGAAVGPSDAAGVGPKGRTSRSNSVASNTSA